MSPMCQILGASHVGCPPILRIHLTSLSVAEQASVEAGPCLVGWAVHALVRLGLYFQLERGRYPPPDFHLALLSFHWISKGNTHSHSELCRKFWKFPFALPRSPPHGLAGGRERLARRPGGPGSPFWPQQHDTYAYALSSPYRSASVTVTRSHAPESWAPARGSRPFNSVE